MKQREFDSYALAEFDAYKEKFFDAVDKGYRSTEIKILREYGINDDSIFLCHLIGVYKASREAGLTK